MPGGRYNELELDAFSDEVERESFCILRDHFPRETLQRWAAAFDPLLRDHIDREGHLKNRGTSRYYVTLPFVEPFADEDIFCDPDVLAITERLVGEDFTMVQLATDTPLRGSDYQDVHRDAPPLFPTWHETPSFQLAVNFPLIDVTPENGPFEVARRTHNVSKEEGLRMIASGETALEPVCLGLGDVMIRDVRHLHRGTPNRTDVPRPMVVIGYSRRWLHRPEVSIRIPKDVWSGLSPQARHLLRYNKVVDSLNTPDEEVYQAFAY